MYEYEKYICSKESLANTIDSYGVAIIPDVLTDKECSLMVDGIWSFFEYISKTWTISIDRNKETSWREFYKLYPLHSMLIQSWNVGHAQVSWDLRQNEKIVDIFSSFWECKPEELLVSFDGLSFSLPPEVTKKGWNRDNTWYHTDQSYSDSSFKCLQSWVTGLDVNEGDATLSFFEGSNKFHGEFSSYFKVTKKDDWYKLNKEEEEFYLLKGCEKKYIKCPKGSLVLWDSRTIHCGVEPFKTRENPNLRAIVYLCYMPRVLCDKRNLEKKKKAFLDLRTTSHWANKPKLFPKTPRTYGGLVTDVIPIPPPKLTSLGLKLAGF